MGEKTLVLIFQSQKGVSVRMSVDDIREDLDPGEVKAMMQQIISNNIFNTNGGDLTAVVGAEIVTRSVEELTMA